MTSEVGGCTHRLRDRGRSQLAPPSSLFMVVGTNVALLSLYLFSSSSSPIVHCCTLVFLLMFLVVCACCCSCSLLCALIDLHVWCCLSVTLFRCVVVPSSFDVGVLATNHKVVDRGGVMSVGWVMVEAVGVLTVDIK